MRAAALLIIDALLPPAPRRRELPPIIFITIPLPALSP